MVYTNDRECVHGIPSVCVCLLCLGTSCSVQYQYNTTLTTLTQQVWKARRSTSVQQYLQAIADGGLRARVLAACEQDLRDLGIAPQDVLN